MRHLNTTISPVECLQGSGIKSIIIKKHKNVRLPFSPIQSAWYYFAQAWKAILRASFLKIRQVGSVRLKTNPVMKAAVTTNHQLWAALAHVVSWGLQWLGPIQQGLSDCVTNTKPRKERGEQRDIF